MQQNTFTLKHLLLVIICAFSFTSTKAQYVNIPDANFRTWLQANGYGSCFSGNMLDTTCAAVVNEDTLAVVIPNNILTFDGLQYFDNLRTFAYSGSATANFTFLPKRLRFFYAGIGSGTAGLVLPDSLEVLYYTGYGNPISSYPNSIKVLDISASSLMTSLPSFPDSLQKLRLYNVNNGLTALPPFPANLKSIDIQYCNTLASISALPPNIENFKLENTLVNTPLGSSSPKLKKMFCSNNQLTSITALPDSLEELWCDHNQLTSLPNLPASLKAVDCSYNQVTSISGLGDSLLVLQCHHNQLTNLNIQLPASDPYYTNPAINCSYNQLTSFPAMYTTLKNLNCSYNNLTSLNVRNFNVIQELNCSHNNITFIDSIHIQNLGVLNCSYNQLTQLPVLSYPAGSQFFDLYLYDFDCSFNQISSIQSLPYSSYNMYIQCQHNQLVNFSFDPNLSSIQGVLFADVLDLGNNNLSYLNLPELNYVVDLLCDSNTNLNNIFSGFTAASADFKNTAVTSDIWFLATDILDVSYCANVTCLPHFTTTHTELYFENSGIACVSGNAVEPPVCYPPFSSLPQCDLTFNPNNCYLNWSISGAVHLVPAGNCNTFGAPVIPNVKVKLYSNTGTLLQQNTTNSYGSYSFNVIPGSNFVIKIDTTNLPYVVACGDSITVPVAGGMSGQSTNNNFGLRCKPNFDLAAQSITRVSGFVFPGQQTDIALAAGDASDFFGTGNNCQANVAATVTAIISGPATYLSSLGTAAPSSVNGDTIRWQLPNVSSIDPYTAFKIVLRTDTTANFGQFVCIDLNITAVSNEVNIVNNRISNCFPVVNSYDPNNKEANPVANITSGEWITYTLNFQNTGTFQAFNIYLADTLSPALDVSSLQVLSSSHNLITQTIGNAIKFNFPNINLPDSFSNEPASHGYVQYRVKANAALTLGTQIENTAFIYFDFNPAVVTNTTLNTVACTLEATATITDSINCHGDSATIVISATGGTAPYTGTGTFVVPAGIYQYIVTDALGCADTINITLTEPDELSIDLLAIEETCGDDSLLIVLDGIGGTLPYTGVGSFFVPYGFIQFTISDANGCTAADTGTINTPDTLQATAQYVVTCGADSFDVVIDATGGVFPYTGTGTFRVAAGSYSFVVEDLAGCSDTAFVTINPSPPLVAVATVTDSIACAFTTGTVIISATGGTPPYTGTDTFDMNAGTQQFFITDAGGCAANVTVTLTQPSQFIIGALTTDAPCGGTGSVLISGSGGTPPYSGDTLHSNLAPGTYTFTAQDAKGCADTITVTVGQASAITASASVVNPLCFGDSGTITITAVNGVAPYTGTGTFMRPAGSYTFIVTDANGCTDTATATITAPAQLVATATGSVTACSATVTIAATGGVAPYTGTGTFNETPGTHQYIITDANGCTDTVSYTVVLLPALNATITATPILCNGDSATITISATGGTTPYNGTGTFKRLAGSYSFVITDANNCADTVNITITQPNILAATAGVTNALCFGGNGSVNVTATGGTQPYTGTGTFSLPAGTHQFVITDANGCTDTVSATVTQPTQLVGGAAVTAPLCHGGLGSVIITATGGAAPYTGTDTFTVAAGTYNYSITDNNGCATNVTAIITEPAILNASITSTNILCNGGTATVTVTATGGTPPYTGTGGFNAAAGISSYVVTDANGCNDTVSINLSQPTQVVATAVVTNALCNNGGGTVTISASGGVGSYTGTGVFNVAAGTYSYIVTDGNGCSDTVSATVTEPAALIVSSQLTAPLCNGDNGTVIISAAGGTMPYAGTGTFTVSAGQQLFPVTDDNGCQVIDTVIVTQPDILEASALTINAGCFGGSGSVQVTATGGTLPYTGTGTFTELPGTYTYVVTDANGCTDTVTAVVNQPAVLQASVTITNALCNGATGSVDVSATGGTAPYTGTGLFNVTAGTYTYVVTDFNGCSDTIDATVTEPTLLQAVAVATSPLCFGGDGSVQITAFGGTAPYTGTGVFVRAAGTHTFVVTDANGCTDTLDVTVTQPSPLFVSTLAIDAGCFSGNGSITVSATGGTTPYTGTGQFSAPAGLHTYIVTDANGCVDSSTAIITEPTLLIATLTTDSIGCAGGSADVTINASGGTPPYTGTGTLTAQAGTTSFIVTDANGCSDTISVTLTNPAPLSASAVVTNGGNLQFGAVDLTITGGAQPYNFSWSNTDTTEDIGGLTIEGYYTVTITDANGCELVDSFFVDFISGIGSIENNISFSLMPNPANNYVVVNVATTLKNEATLKVYNAIGALITEQVIGTQQNVQLDISLWQSGVYFVSIESAKLKAVKRLVKQD